jgi:ABC-type multidrug transport system fused ATPase/permease subunit
LTVTQTRELIEGLKGAVQDFAAAEEKLNREFRQKVDATEKRFKEDSEALAAQLAGQLAEANTAFETAKARFQTRDEQRTARITRARKSSQKLSVERIEQEEGGWKHRSQKGLLDTKRWRTDSFALNDTRLAEFNSQLGENRGAFAALEQAADKSFRGYGKFRRQLAGGKVLPNTDLSPDEHQLLEKLRELHGHTAEDLAKFNGLLLPKIFRVLPLWLWFAFLAVVAGALPMILQQLGKGPITHVQTGIAAAIVFGLVLGTYLSGQSKASSLANTISNELETARRLHQIASEKAQTRHATEVERIEREAKERADMYNEHWRTAVQQAAQAREVWPGAIEAKWRRVAEKNVRLNETRFTRLETEHTATATRLNQEANTRKQTLTETHRARIEKFNADYQAHWKKLEEDWQQSIQPIWNTIRQANMAAEESFPPWQPDLWKNWRPPGSFKNAARFARLELDLKKFADAAPQDKRLAFPGPSVVSLPLVLTYPNQGSILFETTKSGNESVVAALNNIIFRLLATSPAGKLSFTIIDPVKLGQNFAAVTHLADFEENILNGRIWTQSNQIEEQLARLNEHMEKVIQMYLRNEYETIAEYNVQAGNIAEKYHFVVIADFPANFSETAVKRLLRIAASGARCGVFTLIHWDHRHTTPPDFFPEELRKSSVCINATENHFVLAHPMLPRANVLLDAPPDADFATEFLQRVGEISRGSNRVEVPFEQVAPPAAETWSEETTEELRVPIGRSGATKLQYLSIGKGTRQHALIAGKTGSGKSTLFHIIITNLALWCSPEQVEFYLVDFKKGVEFKSYAANRLPHAKVVAIESDREFGLSVLQKLDEELKRRGELFRKLGVQDVAGYKRAGGTEPMPRALLMIDEFQEFFVEDDRISQAANLLLDRIVRQGRAFGIHCLLGSQTLGGAYTLARTTIGQMVIRIALQCNEADAYLIMDENNPAPRLLSRPGEGIYNDMAGMMEGNSPFQAVWLGDEERDVRLERVRALADEKLNGNYPGPIVFEGNAPADVRENLTLRSLLDAPAVQPSPLARVWLGAPNSIKGPTEAVFQKRSGNNLLMVGQRDEPVLAMLSVALISLAAQFPRGTARFILFESTATASPEREFLERTIKAIPHEITLARGGDFSEIMNGLADDLKRRTDSEHADAPTTFVFIHGLQNFKKFKQDEDFAFTTDDSSGANAAAQLQKLISEGPSHGIHVFATVDTYNNVNRYLGRKTLSEFEMRVLFQMSTNDSASLCDDPKASTLGLHRALFYNEQEGYLETFRPYALPGSEWIEQTAKKLSR